ncbi:MAG: phosphoglucosamine mutase, partial [Desulfobacterota bacterium]|nr:phosphoglucosamine mutase [Thermodesulfobacteriota bacterium]
LVGSEMCIRDSTTCDGILTALQVLSIMLRNGKPLSELSRVIQLFPQVLVNVDVKETKDIAQYPVIVKQINHAQSKLKDRGRVVVRPSGTEPKIRIMVEGEEEVEIRTIAEELAETIRITLGEQKQIII